MQRFAVVFRLNFVCRSLSRNRRLFGFGLSGLGDWGRRRNFDLGLFMTAASCDKDCHDSNENE